MLIENYSDKEISFENFKDLINDSNPVVVNFFSDGGIDCLMMIPIIEDIANNMEDIKFININIEDNPEIAEKFNISK